MGSAIRESLLLYNWRTYAVMLTRICKEKDKDKDQAYKDKDKDKD